MTIDRRAFLATATAAAALRGASGAGAQDAARGDLKLGVASYSLRKFPRARAIQMIRALRTPYVCIKDFHMSLESAPAQLEAGRKEFADAGLTVLGGGVIYLEKPDEPRKMFEYCKAAGMPMMIAAPRHELLPEMEKLAREYNIRVAIHNHGPEDKLFPTPQSVLTAIQGMDRRLGLCIDVGHTLRAGKDVVQSVREAGRRLFDMHIKDLRDGGAKAEGCIVGEGKMPIAAIFKELRRINYRDGVMLEYEIDEDDPLPGMQRSFAYMRGVLAGLRG